ncbi:hypothetical protein PF003_g4353 [Phytophthora fragariae]|nr:hypothetical protein PF003_g4353 [Phytophthora fragariae]
MKRRDGRAGSSVGRWLWRVVMRSILFRGVSGGVARSQRVRGLGVEVALRHAHSSECEYSVRSVEEACVGIWMRGLCGKDARRLRDERCAARSAWQRVVCP